MSNSWECYSETALWRFVVDYFFMDSRNGTSGGKKGASTVAPNMECLYMDAF